jgi:hypothetical protein
MGLLTPEEIYIGYHCAGRCCLLGAGLSAETAAATAAGYQAADELAAEPGSGVVSGDPKHRALRHCVASGYLASQRRNCDCANCIGTARENYQTNNGQSRAEENMGVFNNRAGLECAGCRHAHDWYYTNPEFRSGWRSLEQIKKCCREKLSNNQLALQDPNPGGPRPRGGGSGHLPPGGIKGCGC